MQPTPPAESDDDMWGSTEPTWKCQECGWVPVTWKAPPAGWLKEHRDGRLCRNCRSHAVIPVGL